MKSTEDHAIKPEVALITGAAAGLGRAMAASLAADGLVVVATDVDQEGVQSTAEALRASGATVEGLELDVRDGKAVEQMVRLTVERHGRLDWMVNNAGIAVVGEMASISPESWQRVIDVNLLGVVHGCRAAIPRMAARGRGRILNIASLAGLRPFPMSTPYAATKHAVVGLSLSLRAEVARSGVGVTVACPGFIETSIYDNAELVDVDRRRLKAGIPFSFVPVDTAATRILDACRRNRAMVVFPWWARLSWWTFRLSPALSSVIDRRLSRHLRARCR